MSEPTLKEKLLAFSKRTTVHAIPNIVISERTLLKVIWIICLAMATMACFFFVAMTFEEYLKFEVDTVIEIIDDEEAEFPTLTFCNMQICGFKDYDFSSYLKKYKQDEQDKFGSNQDAVIEEKLKRNNTKTSFFSAKEVFLRKYDDKELTKILNKNKTSISDILISCKLGDEPCSEVDFDFFQMGEFHKCYKYNFNESRLKKVKKNLFKLFFFQKRQSFFSTLIPFF